ncbi:dUTP diphosphatase [uncultured Rikenella sp.]|uniref:dUTP diphosphatase n=1 Tax=uncultured Rikenella sp. TaxID=368003 RepID=UPI0025DFA76D|nr:dUTP diphosphatase [uncultured Rikenella sp.]
MEKVKVINRSGNPLPAYETAQAVGLDVRAHTLEPITIGPLERVMVPTGLYFQIPEGYEIQVRPRSGLAAKHGITVINSPGTIDPDYRGELKVLLVNLSNEPFEMQPGERVAQLVFARYERLAWEEAVVLDETRRGEGGFGSTGVK